MVPIRRFRPAAEIADEIAAAFQLERTRIERALPIAEVPHTGASSIPSVLITAVGGEHDRRFIAGWERLRADPSLIDKLNALKLRHEATSTPEEYEAAKSAFFSALELR